MGFAGCAAGRRAAMRPPLVATGWVGGDPSASAPAESGRGAGSRHVDAGWSVAATEHDVHGLVPLGSSSEGQGHRREERQRHGEARQVRLHGYHLKVCTCADPPATGRSSEGRSLALRPRLATGLPWTRIHRGADIAPYRERGCAAPSATTSNVRVALLHRVSASGAPPRRRCRGATRPASMHRRDHRDGRPDTDQDVADAEDVGHRDPGRHREQVGQRPEDDPIGQAVVGVPLARGRPMATSASALTGM